MLWTSRSPEGLNKMIDYLIKNVLRHTLIECVPGHLLKTQETCNEIMRTMQFAFHLIPDRFKTEEMCIRGIEVDPWALRFVPDHFKTQKRCDKAVRYYPVFLQFVPDWLVIQEWIDLWNDHYYVYERPERI